MRTLQAIEDFKNKLVNLNWYVFGAVLLTVGMAVITGHIAWFVISIPLVWAFGLVSAGVIGGRVLARRAKLDLDENE